MLSVPSRVEEIRYVRASSHCSTSLAKPAVVQCQTRFGFVDHNKCVDNDGEVAHHALLGHLQLGMLGLQHGFFLTSEGGVLRNP